MRYRLILRGEDTLCSVRVVDENVYFALGGPDERLSAVCMAGGSLIRLGYIKDRQLSTKLYDDADAFALLREDENGEHIAAKASRRDNYDWMPLRMKLKPAMPKMVGLEVISSAVPARGGLGSHESKKTGGPGSVTVAGKAGEVKTQKGEDEAAPATASDSFGDGGLTPGPAFDGEGGVKIFPSRSLKQEEDGEQNGGNEACAGDEDALDGADAAPADMAGTPDGSSRVDDDASGGDDMSDDNASVDGDMPGNADACGDGDAPGDGDEAKEGGERFGGARVVSFKGGAQHVYQTPPEEEITIWEPDKMGETANETPATAQWPQDDEETPWQPPEPGKAAGLKPWNIEFEQGLTDTCDDGEDEELPWAPAFETEGDDEKGEYEGVEYEPGGQDEAGDKRDGPGGPGGSEEPDVSGKEIPPAQREDVMPENDFPNPDGEEGETVYPFDGVYAEYRWIKVSQGRTHYLSGTRPGAHAIAVPGAYSLTPPKNLSGFTDYAFSNCGGGYWIKIIK